MPQSAGVLRVGRYFLSLFLIFVVLYGLVFLPGHGRTPKLGLDLEGGAQIIFKAKTDSGKTPSKDSMRVARQILTNRVNGTGVQGAEVVQQGNNRIVVSVPGKSTKDLAGVGKAASLAFRPLVMPAIAVTPTAPVATTPSASGSSSSTTNSSTTKSSTSKSGAKASNSASKLSGTSVAHLAPQAAPTTTKKTSTTPKASASATTPKIPAVSADLPAPFNQIDFALPTSEAAYAKLSQTQQQILQYALQAYNCSTPAKDVPTKGFVACNDAGTVKYLLGAVIIAGKQVSTASAQAPNVSSGETQYTVNLKLKGSAQSVWAKYTGAHSSNTETADDSTCGPSATPCAEFVAFTLDDKVIVDPHNQAAITGDTQISGSFTQTSAEELANQLKFGALPLDFSAETQQNVSPTLGSSQLKSGLLAGGIGLALVVLYSLLYYRGLGLVTIASLLVSGGITYASLVILGREIGFTLSLAGIAGFIVAVGITADSFVVFFERIKDEVHEGRSLRVAVPRAWARSRRTIISADFVSFLAAAVLYLLASGDVRGFAFTLGMSTIVDLVVVFLFTHPLVALLSRSRAFGSPRFTGLNALRGPSPALAMAGAGSGAAVLDRAPARSSAEPGQDLAAADIDDADGADDAATDEPAPEEAPRRAPRSSATAGKVDVLSAAERAAARRGRTVQAEAETSNDADSSVDVTEENSARPRSRRLFGRSGNAEPVRESELEADPPADAAATSSAAEDEAAQATEPPAAVTTSGSAAERAAERRRRRRGAAEPEPPAAAPAGALRAKLEVSTAEVEPDPADVPAEPEPQPAAAEVADVAADVEPPAEAVAEPEEIEDIEEDPQPTPGSAAARAAARRARIRARADAEGGGR